MRTPSLSPDFFTNNRKALVAKAGPESLILMQSASEMVRNSDTLHSWRQDSNFFYFSGLDHLQCSLLLIPGDNGKAEEILFIPPVDLENEKWNGKMLTKDEARKISGIKTVQYNDTLLTTLFRVQKWKEVLYCEVNDLFPSQPLTPQHLLLEDLAKRLPGLQLKKLAFLTTPLRMSKKLEEVGYVKKSLGIIETALKSVMKKLKPDMMEYQVEAELVYQYIFGGCKRQGFEAIVAGGRNAATLHYVSNSAKLNDGDLVLIDTGGEYGMYSGDITRVYPINGKFSSRQRECYQAVLEVNQRFIKELKSGYTWKQLHEMAAEITGEVYARCGFIENAKDYLTVSYHRIGHFLGLDIHDVGRLDSPMESGTIITVEPGLYLPEESIGIRIEDNVLLTEDGAENLSASIPKEIDEIEKMMA